MAIQKDVHKGHRQRMRDRAANEGLDSFEPHQVMELLLFYAVPIQDVSELAHRLINELGSVYRVLNASREQLMAVEGVGKRVADWLTAFGEAVNAYGALKPGDRPAITNANSAIAFSKEMRRKAACPGAYQLCLAPAGEIRMCSLHCEGTAWGEPQPLRRSIREAMAVHARNVLMILFTQDAFPTVAEYDRKSASEYAMVLHAMNAELVDVILVGSEETISMHKSGDYKREPGQRTSALAEYYLREEDAPTTEYELPETDDGL